MAQRAPLPMTTVLTTEVLQSLLTDEAACSALTKKKGAGGKIGASHMVVYLIWDIYEDIF